MGAMRRVAIVGGGTTQFKPRWIDKTHFELAYDAAKEAFEHAHITREDVQSVVYGVYLDLFERQIMPDVLLHEYLGLGTKAGTRVTTGGATGGAALRVGFMEIASGLRDLVLVLGAEKCADLYYYKEGKSAPEVIKAISYSADMTYENPTGRSSAASFALPLVAHIAKYGGPTEEQMAKVSVKNHGNAKLNPKAQSPLDLTVEDVLRSPMISYPFKLLDNCLYSEGAAAVVLASEDVARTLTDKPIWITGVGASMDWIHPGSRRDIAEFASTRLAQQEAYKMAGIKDPLREIDVAELHDAFTGTEIMSYEDCAFCLPGEGGRLIEDGVVGPGGDLPVNMSGGLLGCGHAVGATGIMQTVEILLQLRGEAGRRQVKNARRGLVQSIGGALCCWTYSFIMEREG